MNRKLAAITLVALVWGRLAFCGEIHDAAKAGDLEKVKTLLKANPDLVFSKDSNGNTPLHSAAYMGRKNVAELLLANKADVNATNLMIGFTPLMEAMMIKGHKDVVKLLLVNDADVNTKATGGFTPLHLAASNGEKDVVELLLANKAEVNAEAHGSTPLHAAAAMGHSTVVELLLANGARVNAITDYGWTPLHCAVNGNHQDVAELLRQHGGTNDMKPAPPSSTIHFSGTNK